MEKQGIIEYSIIRQGDIKGNFPCDFVEQDPTILTGIYTNAPNDGRFFNEIARKTDQKRELVGRYETFYFLEPLVPCQLDIRLLNPNRNVFDLFWFDSPGFDQNSDPRKEKIQSFFRGIGFLFPQNRMIVHYTWK